MSVPFFSLSFNVKVKKGKEKKLMCCKTNKKMQRKAPNSYFQPKYIMPLEVRISLHQQSIRNRNFVNDFQPHSLKKKNL